MSALLLDSHVWLWLGLGVQLSEDIVALCEESARKRQLYLSPFSVWELSRKCLSGQIDLPAPTGTWMVEQRRRTAVQIAEFDFNVAYDVHELPAGFHKDPVDRILASTCRLRGMTLMTRDESLLKFAREGRYAVMPV